MYRPPLYFRISFYLAFGISFYALFILLNRSDYLTSLIAFLAMIFCIYIHLTVKPKKEV